MRKAVRVKNLTSLFSREILIYSFYDVKLSKPARLVTVGYFFALSVVILGPVIYFKGFSSPTLVILALAISFAGATVMSKPIWGGRSFVKYMKVQLRYAFSPKVYADNVGVKDNKEYKTDNQIQVSRHDDFNKLYKLEQNEREDRRL